MEFSVDSHCVGPPRIQENEENEERLFRCTGRIPGSTAGDTDLLLYSNKLIYFSINYHRIDFFFFICGSCQLQILEQSIREWKHFFFFKPENFLSSTSRGVSYLPSSQTSWKTQEPSGEQLFLIHRLSVSCPCKLISSYSSWSRLRKSPSCLLSSLHISFFKY